MVRTTAAMDGTVDIMAATGGTDTIPVTVTGAAASVGDLGLGSVGAWASVSAGVLIGVTPMLLLIITPIRAGVIRRGLLP
jgi:hypothetical protein